MAAPNVTVGPYPERLIRVGVALKDKPGLVAEGMFLPGADVVLGTDNSAGGWSSPDGADRPSSSSRAGLISISAQRCACSCATRQAVTACAASSRSCSRA
jgi:hypothetical protein